MKERSKLLDFLERRYAVCNAAITITGIPVMIAKYFLVEYTTLLLVLTVISILCTILAYIVCLTLHLHIKKTNPDAYMQRRLLFILATLIMCMWLRWLVKSI